MSKFKNGDIVFFIERNATHGDIEHECIVEDMVTRSDDPLYKIRLKPSSKGIEKIVYLFKKESELMNIDELLSTPLQIQLSNGLY